MKRPMKKLTDKQLLNKLDTALHNQIHHPHESGRAGWVLIEQTIKDEMKVRGLQIDLQ